MKEADEVEEDLDARVLGNILHDVMEKFYKDIIEKKKLGDADGYIIQIEVILTIELQYLILYWADNVKVLEPSELVEDIKSRLSRIVNNYKLK